MDGGRSSQRQENAGKYIVDEILNDISIVMHGMVFSAPLSLSPICGNDAEQYSLRCR
jgi:hypothetical protein